MINTSRICICVLLLGILCMNLFTDCSKREDSIANNLAKNCIRDITGNIFGILERQGDWIYYANSSNDDKLYKIKIDGSGKTKLNNCGVDIIAVKGEWIYFAIDSDEGKLYKIKTDGTKQIKLCDFEASEYKLIGDWIYYLDFSNKNQLFKMKIDGTNKTKLVDESMNEFILDNEMIYYIGYSNEGIYRIKTDGTDKFKISSEKVLYFSESGDWIYYTTESDGSTICKVNFDGMGKTSFTTVGSVECLVAKDEWIYYSSGRGIFKVKADFSEFSQLFDMDVDVFGVTDKWIYFNASPGKADILRIKADGSTRSPIGVNQ